MNKELAKTLTTALVQFIDKERPEESMCCSNAECEAIEQAFIADNFFYVETLVQGKLSRLTEFELEVSDIVDYCKAHGENVAFDYAKRHAKTLLALAKKELARQGEIITLDNIAPYDKGLQDGKAEAMADLERAVTCGNVDNIPKWLQEELNKAFKKGQESNHEDYLRGYSNGYRDAQEEYNKSVAYNHDPSWKSGF